MLAIIDTASLTPLIILAVLLGLSPFYPEPHLTEKLRMLFQGTLTRPLDIFDLLMHAAPIVLLALKLWRMRWRQQQTTRSM
ncbi:hypothetical protein B1C78_05610 [Thioalkalivibrio denitrificans]|uniref:RND transporter n=1 Tax=Thioalkalivibrio denitrificans TaxID=108003 RepID=A0A1V3NLN2_9GAMM|nr:hypothetical protein B1C78_05610 [Thioalkalivibrio denitrificans]